MARRSRQGSMELVSAASAGKAPEVARMPRPTLRLMMPMRDGVRLDTWIWLPLEGEGPWPAILFRTPYKETVTGWARLDPLFYRDAGYAVIFQLIRGIGASEGRFTFIDPLNRTDGYDSVEWIAAQPWCTGAVGMDGSSYVGITQLMAAVEQPPSLKAIVPAVVSVDYFNDVPRFGGIFSRQHTLGWTQFTSVDSLAEITPGLWGDRAFLAAPDAWRLLMSRPAIDAAEGVLADEQLQHYRDILAHPTFDDWWRVRTLMPEDYARIDVPTLVVTGLFDSTAGSQTLWHMLERYGPADAERRLLIGPWDHGEAYVGGGLQHGCWQFGEAAEAVDIQQIRLAFFDRHLRGIGDGPPLADRVTSYILGANRWAAAPSYPQPGTAGAALFLRSDGLANLRGHGRLSPEPAASEPPDNFLSDPDLPFLPVIAAIAPERQFELAEVERSEDVLVYAAPPLAAPLLLHGEAVAELHVAADAPDADIVCRLGFSGQGSGTTFLSQGMLRLRHREGFDRALPLVPGEAVVVTIRMTHVGVELPTGSRIKLLIGGDLFPLLEPNPHTGEDDAIATAGRPAIQTIFHDAAHPSLIRLPVAGGDAPRWS